MKKINETIDNVIQEAENSSESSTKKLDVDKFLEEKAKEASEQEAKEKERPNSLKDPEFIEILSQYRRRDDYSAVAKLLLQSPDDVDCKRDWVRSLSHEAKKRLFFETFTLNFNPGYQTYYLGSLFGYADSLDLPWQTGTTYSEPIPTGFSNLDDVLGGGLLPGLFVIGGAPSTGKTAFIIQMITNIVPLKIPQLFFSLEINKQDLRSRFLALGLAKARLENKELASISVNDFRTKARSYVDTPELELSKQFENMVLSNVVIQPTKPDIFKLRQSSSINKMNSTNLREEYHLNTSSFNIETIELFINDYVKTLSKFYKEAGYNSSSPVIYIDFLQRINTDTISAIDRYGEIMRRLKNLSNEHNIPIVVLSSLNREFAYKSFASIAFKESGSIESEADIAGGFQYADISHNYKKVSSNGRSTDYDESDIEKFKAQKPRFITLKISKHRGGNDASVDFAYYSDYNYFIPWDYQNKRKYQPNQSTKSKDDQ